jgi:hypothetical protein
MNMLANLLNCEERFASTVLGCGIHAFGNSCQSGGINLIVIPLFEHCIDLSNNIPKKLDLVMEVSVGNYGLR